MTTGSLLIGPRLWSKRAWVRAPSLTCRQKDRICEGLLEELNPWREPRTRAQAATTGSWEPEFGLASHPPPRSESLPHGGWRRAEQLVRRSRYSSRSLPPQALPAELTHDYFESGDGVGEGMVSWGHFVAVRREEGILASGPGLASPQES
jgi:hypothetical protein